MILLSQFRVECTTSNPIMSLNDLLIIRHEIISLNYCLSNDQLCLMNQIIEHFIKLSLKQTDRART